jgi:hypothetical protein
MDMKAYYQRIRETEAKISEPFPIIASLETHDGGKAGVLTEVSRPLAAKAVVEGVARLATEEEARAFRATRAEAHRAAEEAAAAAKVQLAVLPASELRRLTGRSSAPKE